MSPPQEVILASSSSVPTSVYSSTKSSRRSNPLGGPAAPPPTTLSGSTTAGPSSITLHDLTSTTLLQSFKPSATSSNGLSYTQSRLTDASDAAGARGGGLLFATQEGKAILNVWAWQKDQMLIKIHLPEKMDCFETSGNGLWAAGGTKNGHVYLWEIASGHLLASFDAAYRSITHLLFTPCSQALLISSSDSSISCYSIPRLVDSSLLSQIPQPYCSMTNHTLPITGIRVSSGVFPNVRVYSISEDATLKIFSLGENSGNPSLLSSFALPPGQSPTALTVDPAERYVYIGTDQGEIFHVGLYKRRREIGAGNGESNGDGGFGHGEEHEEVTGDWGILGDGLVAVGGGGIQSSNIPIESSSLLSSSKAKGKISLNQPITSLTLSISQTHLLTGLSTGYIHIHSLPSHTHLRTISTHAGSPITHLETMLRPADLVGHLNLGNLSTGGGNSHGNGGGIGGSGKKDEWPIQEIKVFERMKVGRANTTAGTGGMLDREVGLLLKSSITEEEMNELDSLDTSDCFSLDDGNNGYSTASNAGLSDLSSATTTATMDQTLALQSEITKLQAQLKRAKEINESIWNGVVNKAFEKEKRGGGDAAAGYVDIGR